MYVQKMRPHWEGREDKLSASHMKWQFEVGFSHCWCAFSVIWLPIGCFYDIFLLKSWAFTLSTLSNATGRQRKPKVVSDSYLCPWLMNEHDFVWFIMRFSLFITTDRIYRKLTRLYLYTNYLCRDTNSFMCNIWDVLNWGRFFGRFLRANVKPLVTMTY